MSCQYNNPNDIIIDYLHDIRAQLIKLNRHFELGELQPVGKGPSLESPEVHEGVEEKEFPKEQP